MHTSADEGSVGEISALSTRQEYATRLLVKRGDRIRFVPVNAVEYFEADGSNVTLHAGTDKHRIRRTLKDIQAQLDPRQFVRIHRSTIVNLEHIVACSATTCCARSSEAP